MEVGRIEQLTEDKNPNSPSAAIVRPAVAEFAHAMEKILQNNDHKGGWDKEGIGYLTEHLEGEMNEFNDYITEYVGWGKDLKEYTDFEKQTAMSELIDIANFTMMLWDKIRRS